MYSIIVAPIDLSAPESSERILDRAMFFLQNSQASIYFLTVAAVTTDKSSLEELRTQLQQFISTKILENTDRTFAEVGVGKPSKAIIEFAQAKKADCVLVGAHRGGGLLGLNSLGSTAAIVAAQASSDVCVVKGPS
ncbi:universal stress protein [Reinekea marina]|uniref:Universal stress protein n=1 Tax=Reinekea marina TaxID=1310421 RepID=A0ABV7WQF0_9GAMM|nr:universal stress protein [Reinekea marina]MDN3648226.1 universal stress protein [Reinekea marina]